MFKILKKCTHSNTKTITNIYGDTINAFNAKSIKICNNCGKIIYSSHLDKECDFIQRNEGEYCDTL